MSPERVSTSVSQAHTDAWKYAATTIRYHQELLHLLGDPAPGSALASDDGAVHGEYLSDAVRSSLSAALDNLHLWADVVMPPVFIDGSIVQHPPRPYFTLARAGLEASAQAAWVLSPQDADTRVDRHLSLAVDNLEEMRKAVRHTDDARAQAARTRIDTITAAHARPIGRAPSYVSMVREVAVAAGSTPDAAEALWRTASAAAHGKLWFTSATHDVLVGPEFAPGRHRALHLPDATKITETITLATGAAAWATNRYAELAGADVNALHPAVMATLEANQPRRVRVVSD